jgi:hypothetical protein
VLHALTAKLETSLSTDTTPTFNNVALEPVCDMTTVRIINAPVINKAAYGLNFIT